MIVILCAVMLMQALSLPPVHKRSDVLNPTNYFHRSLIEFDPKKPSDYRFIIEASSSKVKQCFYYIDKNGKLIVVCQKGENGKENKDKAIILDTSLVGQVHTLIRTTNKLKGELLTILKKDNKVNYKDKYVAVDILATAGMRKKTLTDQTKIWSTFIELWQTASKREKDGLLQLNTIQDTSGVEEGIYGCMIANVALGNLDLSLRHKASVHPMVGIIEIGGASAQIAVPQIAVPIEGTNFNDFKDFHSRSIPFGKDYFWDNVMGKIMPPSCQYPDTNFDDCCVFVLGKIIEQEESVQKKKQWNLPKEILKYSRYYLLGGTFGHAWADETIKANRELKKEANAKGKDGQQLVKIAVLEEWTKAMCIAAPKENEFAQEACYSSVYAYSFLKHFLKDNEDVEFYIDKPLSNSDLLRSGDVDWPSAAYLYLKSHAYDLPSTEVSVTVIKDDQYKKS